MIKLNFKNAPLEFLLDPNSAFLFVILFLPHSNPHLPIKFIQHVVFIFCFFIVKILRLNKKYWTHHRAKTRK